eukprot:m.296180 g.296180  ORF g.296180 m.296180 type:complete len:1416 (-) comp16393_c6_seq55:75-4322(-)
MENLTVETQRVREHQGRLSDNKHLPVCVTSSNDLVWVTDNKLTFYKSDKNKENETVSIVDDANEAGEVVEITYLAEDVAVVVAFSGGDLIQYQLQTQEYECVGTFDDGIAAVRWSPDEELLAILTKAGVLLLLSRDYDVIAETPVSREEFGAAEPINVGWGKKETQFRGKAGKLKPGEDAVEEGGAAPTSDTSSIIRWRGDGEYFVTSTVEPDEVGGSKRVLRVWDRNADLQATGEKSPGLCSPLAWRPAGNLIASSQKRHKKHEVVFYERNGLQHGSFALPFEDSKSDVISLSWNSDSTILMTHINIAAGCDSANEGTRVQLWTMSNYHWYLQQEFVFDVTSSSERILASQWDIEKPNRLFLVTSKRIHEYQIGRFTHISRGLYHSNPAMVGMIDGSSVKLTSFRHAVVPPPMSSSVIETPRDTVRQISFAPSLKEDSDTFVVCTTNLGNLHFTRLLKESSETLASLALKDVCNKASESVSEALNTGVVPRHVTWLRTTNISGNKHHILFFLLAKPGSSNDYLVVFSVNEAYTVEKVVCTETSSVSLVAPDDGTPNLAVSALFCEQDCVVKKLTVTHSLEVGLSSWDVMDSESKFKSPRNLSIFYMASEDDVVEELGLDNVSDDGVAESIVAAEPEQSHKKLVVALLTHLGELFLDGNLIASNCNSFAVHDEYFIFTLTSHQCRFISTRWTVSQALKAMATNQDSDDNPFLSHSLRELERGSRIVAVAPRQTKIILQMPRGNLESIWPRALVLTAARHLLHRKLYRNAFGLLRKHRINLNLLYDYDPNTFETEIHDVVTALGEPLSINLFLTDLRDEDVTKTMYWDNTNGIRDASLSNVSGKRNRVCDLVRDAVMSVPGGSEKYQLCVVHSYLSKSTPQIDRALEYIREIRDQTEEGQLVDDLEDFGGQSLADSLLKYAAVIVKDPELLYKEALGTYDFDLVVLVAQVAQKDPKEYLPFLEELSTLEPSFRKYKVDMHLKRYAKALAHLADAGDSHFESCVELMEHQRLYSEGLEIFEKIGGEKLNVIRGKVGVYLSKKGYHKEGGMQLRAAGKLEEALDAFQKGLDWKWAFIVATEMDLTAGKLLEVAENLAARLQAGGRAREAALVAEQYLSSDVERCVELWLNAKDWAAAILVAQRSRRQDILEADILPAISAASVAFYEGIAGSEGLIAQLNKHADRLTVVRKDKARRAEEYFHEEGRPGDDLYSDTTSVTGMTGTRASSGRAKSSKSGKSMTSKNSGKTHRSRRREKRKLTSLREGGIYEEVALLEALNSIVERSITAKSDIVPLSEALMFFGQREQVVSMENALDLFLSAVDSRYLEIWPVNMGLGTASENTFGPNTTANARAESFRLEGSKPVLNVSDQQVTLRSVKVDDIVVNVPPFQLPNHEGVNSVKERYAKFKLADYQSQKKI